MNVISEVLKLLQMLPYTQVKVAKIQQEMNSWVGHKKVGVCG